MQLPDQTTRWSIEFISFIRLNHNTGQRSHVIGGDNTCYKIILKHWWLLLTFGTSVVTAIGTRVDIVYKDVQVEDVVGEPSLRPADGSASVAAGAIAVR